MENENINEPNEPKPKKANGKPSEPPPKASMDAVEKLSKDMKEAAKTLGVREARYFVDTYYQMQDNRIAAANQQRALGVSAEPSLHIAWLNCQMETMEGQIRIMLDKWSGAQPMGQWARAITGIGPVISAGLLANIDITKAPTSGHIWRFAGLDPTSKWLKGQKRPWNASLKRLCWLIGESFVKVSGNQKDIYGKYYLQRKAYETAKNNNKDYADQAHAHLERILKNKRSKGALVDPDPPETIITDAGELERAPRIDSELTDEQKSRKLQDLLRSGMLPPAAIHARSKRYAVKLFLAHYHDVYYRLHYGVEPPLPYSISILGHAHVIPPPPMIMV